MVNINTTPGDGGVRVGVDAFGEYGSAVFNDGTSDAFYDPIGIEAEAGTVYESLIAFRFIEEETRSFLSELGTNPVVAESTDTSVSSSFNIDNLNFQLEQSVEDLISEGSRTGSILSQEYTITNNGAETLSFELLRYLDGDLDFDGSISDTGGRRIRDDEEVLFETDGGENPVSSTTFVGITATGGDESSPGRFEIDEYSDLRDRIVQGIELDEQITGDSEDPDQFVDSGAYDITLALRNGFTLEPGESTNYTTNTVFGEGSPDRVNIVPGSGSIINSSDGEVIGEDDLNIPVYRFRNNSVSGTYIFTGEEERQTINQSFDNFVEEGMAFTVGSQPGDGLIPIYRFQSRTTPGTYTFVGEEERQGINENFSESFVEEGLAFYVYGAGSGQGTTFYRFQNTAQPGTYLFAGTEERENILANFPSFVEEGAAFEVGI